MTPADPRAPATLLRQAMLVLCQVAELERTPEGLIAWGAERMRRRPEPSQRWTGGMQRHSTLEVCLALRGTGVLDVTTARFRFRAPALALIASGVLHSEGFYDRNESYASVWFVLNAEDRIQIHVSEYQPKQGWSCPWDAELSRRATRQLRASFQAPEPELDGVGSVAPAPELEPLRAELLAACSELHRAQTHQTVRRVSDTDSALATPGHRRVLEWVRRYLDRHYHRPISVREIAELTRYSPNYIDALFSAWLGKGIVAYVIERRMQEALRLCEASDLSVQAIAQSVGYEDAFYFSRVFRRHHGRAPSAVRKRRARL